MTAPIKPWEMSYYRMNTPEVFNSGGAYMSSGNVINNTPPPLPPRPYQQNNMGYGGYENTYNSYGGGFHGGYGNGYSGYNSISGYNGYGGYGGYGYGYNRFNNFSTGSNLEGRFIQIAEENCRPAFQSIESVVGACSGIAAMLDSTYMAMTSSFRAILGVTENFGRLRSLFSKFWSTFAVIRSINWLYRKILSFLGIAKYDPGKAQAWAEALSGEHKDNERKGSTWPILVFLGIIASAPYIIMKLLGGLNQSIIEESSDPTKWRNSQLAVALYDLPNPNQGELSLRASQNVKVAPLVLQKNLKLMNSGWLLASCDNRTSGLVPANYIKVIKGNYIPRQNIDSGNQQIIPNKSYTPEELTNIVQHLPEAEYNRLEHTFNESKSVEEENVTT